MNAYRGGFLQKVQNAFVSIIVFYLAGKAQGCVHMFQVGYRWRPGMLGMWAGSTVNIQD